MSWFSTKGAQASFGDRLMNSHLHQARNVMGWVLAIAAFSPFALCCFEFPSSKNSLSDVTGRVTYSGHPLNDMFLCLDSGGVHSAFSALKSDGSFRLLNMKEGSTGAYRGQYHAHLYSHSMGPSLPAKYGDPKTSGVEIVIGTDWCDLEIDLD
jgi:hypothetical protein